MSMTEITCQQCGNIFNAYSSASRRRKFCNKKCSGLHKRSHPLSHGMSYSRLYGIWCHMKSRCTNPSHAYFQYYGGRGISVCEAWSESFESFQTWAESNGYQPNLEIDRRDTNGNYEPDNCRWATRNQQMQNTRKRSNATTSRYRGVSRELRSRNWRAQGHKNGNPVHIGCFATEILAAHAYDEWTRKNYGEYANPNFKQGGVSY